MLSIAIALALFLGCFNLASTQSIDPNSVPLSTRDRWCNDQTTQCPLICLQLPGVSSSTTESNTCDPTSLSYSCICVNGQSPNASQYSQTIPYFLCTQANNDCVNNCGQGDTACQSACRDDNLCGAQSPTRVNTSTISTMAATKPGGAAASTTAGTVTSTATGTAVYTGFGGSSATTAASGSGSGSSSAAALLNLGQVYGLTIVVSGLFLGFATLL